MLKVQFVEAADAGEKHAVVKLAHVAACLEHYRGIAGLILLFLRGFEFGLDWALGQVTQLDGSFGLCAATLQLTRRAV